MYIMTSNYFTLSPPNGDDCIGTESCMDLQNEIEVEHCDTSKTSGAVKSSIKKEKREFPPPIPLLSGSTPKVPWVLKRYNTSDGRLILKEEKVKHHEYFRARRSNGRLTLELVPFDEEDGVAVDEESSDHSVVNIPTDAEDKISVDEIPTENDKGAVGGGHGGSKCLNCNSVRSSPSCVIGVPICIHLARFTVN